MAGKTSFWQLKQARTWLLTAIVLLIFALPAVAQNTKGDKPVSTSAPSTQKKKLFGKNGQRVGPRMSSSGDKRTKRSDRLSNKPLPSAPVRSTAPRGGDRAYTKTISGKRITEQRSSTNKVKRVYPQRGPFVNNLSPKPAKNKVSSKPLPSAVSRIKPPSGNDRNRAWPKGKTVSGRVLNTKAAPSRKPKVYPQNGPFVRSASIKPRRPDASPKNKPLNKARRLSMSKAAAQARSMGMRGAGFKTITAQFITGPKRNPYWGKERKKREQAYTKDITGRRLRTRDARSPRMGLVSADTLPFARRSPREIKRRPSQPLGGIRSATRTGRAWKGDISGNAIRRRPNRGTSEKAGKFFMPRKFSITAKIKERAGDKPKAALQPSPKIKSKALPPKAPGIGAIAYYQFGKRASALKKAKGAGGSVTASLKKDRRPLPSKGVSASSMRISRFAGNLKSRRPQQGGGSVSGKLWNNNRNSVTVRQAGAGTIQAAQFKGRQRGIAGSNQFGRMGTGFTGHIKTRRPEKGGGSVSGKLWNNRKQPIAVQEGAKAGRAAGIFQGNLKTRRPEKGGGSVSGKIWNNRNQPIAVEQGAKGGRAAGTFQGNIKTRRPEKGGGSVSGKIWNNRNQPIAVEQGAKGGRAAGTFQGNIKTRRPEKGGGSVSGKIWNNKQQPIEVKTGGKGTQLAGNFQGKTKYKKPPETAGPPATFKGKIKGAITGGELSQVGLNYTGDRKQPKYVQNPKAFKESLRKDRRPDGIRLNVPILSQTKRSVNAGHYVKVIKQDWDYKKAPNSAKGALKVREPGRAQPHIGDLQVNVKMQKYNKKELHPDAAFAHSKRDNVKDERTLFMNIRLAWAKLFRKNDTQPRGLKQKYPKPRYDPAEEGIWYK